MQSASRVRAPYSSGPKSSFSFAFAATDRSLWRFFAFYITQGGFLWKNGSGGSSDVGGGSLAAGREEDTPSNPAGKLEPGCSIFVCSMLLCVVNLVFRSIILSNASK